MGVAENLAGSVYQSILRTSQAEVNRISPERANPRPS